MARSNGDAEENIREDFDKLRADVAALTKDLKLLVQQRGEGAVSRGRAAVEDIGEHLNSASRAVTQHVVDRPVTSLAVSFLAGLVMGQILRR